MKIDRVDFGSWNQTSSLDETVIGSSYHLELSSIPHANLCPVCFRGIAYYFPRYVSAFISLDLLNLWGWIRSPGPGSEVGWDSSQVFISKISRFSLFLGCNIFMFKKKEL